jgi:hypothetical protein
MVRWLIAIIIVSLIASNAYLFVSLNELKGTVSTSEDRISVLTATTQRQASALEEASKQLVSLKPTAPASAPPQSPQTNPRNTVSELALAQSYKLDRVVEWVGLIEDKIYFILFPPQDIQEKDRQALELRGRTDQIRSQFQTVAQQELALRERLIQRLAETKSQQP